MKEAAQTLAESPDASTDLPTREKYYWLNDESRLFLSRGYITESPEQRIKDIANNAEKYLKIEGFAKKFG